MSIRWLSLIGFGAAPLNAAGNRPVSTRLTSSGTSAARAPGAYRKREDPRGQNAGVKLTTNANLKTRWP